MALSIIKVNAIRITEIYFGTKLQGLTHMVVVQMVLFKANQSSEILEKNIFSNIQEANDLFIL